MDHLTKREIERRLKAKGLSGRVSKTLVSLLSDALRDTRENPPYPGGLVDLTRFLPGGRDPVE